MITQFYGLMKMGNSTHRRKKYFKVFSRQIELVAKLDENPRRVHHTNTYP